MLKYKCWLESGSGSWMKVTVREKVRSCTSLFCRNSPSWWNFQGLLSQ